MLLRTLREPRLLQGAFSNARGGYSDSARRGSNGYRTPSHNGSGNYRAPSSGSSTSGSSGGDKGGNGGRPTWQDTLDGGLLQII